jgi:hypothetical protein
LLTQFASGILLYCVVGAVTYMYYWLSDFTYHWLYMLFVQVSFVLTCMVVYGSYLAGVKLL